MLSQRVRLVIVSLCFISYNLLFLSIQVGLPLVNPIRLSGMVGTRNGTRYHESNFDDRGSDMVKVTCEVWNGRRGAGLNFTYIDYDTCNVNNVPYNTFRTALYSTTIFSLILWLTLISVSIYSLRTYELKNRIIIYIVYLMLFIIICLDIYSITTAILMHTFVGGDVYEVNGYVDVGEEQLPIYGQFQLAEYVCNIYNNTQATWVTVHLTTCQLGTEYTYMLYPLRYILRFITFIMFFIGALYAWINENNRDSETIKLYT